MDQTAPEQLLLEAIGPRFLEYVLNAPKEQVARRLHEPGFVLSDRQEAAIQELTQLLARTTAQHRHQNVPWFLLLDILGQVIPELGTSWANATREAVGGTTAIPKLPDQVRNLLSEMARDVYALFLLPAGETFADLLHPPLGRPLHNHPKREQLEAAILEDATLRQLFPHTSETTGPGGYTMRSTGSGGSLQLWTFPEQMIRSGWHMASLSGKTPALSELVQGIDKAVGLISSAVLGEDAKVPVRIGLTGVLLPSGFTVKAPWGTLREVNQLDLRLVPESYRGGLTTTKPDGEHIEIDYAGNVVLEAEIPYRMRIGPTELDDEWPANLRSYDMLQTWSENSQIALLLTLDDQPEVKVVPSWTAIFDPLNYGPMRSFRDTRSVPSLVPHQLTQQEAETWSEWIGLVTDRRVPSIAVAISRTLMAVTERRDTSDALVDTVIAWENLVGSREGEPTLRVSAALAWLLEDQFNVRQERQRAIGRLYKLRSDVVHGNRLLPPREASESSREAIAITLAALRKVFSERSDLLSECRDGAERSKRLILGG
jgi:hypothetical protein